MVRRWKVTEKKVLATLGVIFGLICIIVLLWKAPSGTEETEYEPQEEETIVDPYAVLVDSVATACQSIAESELDMPAHVEMKKFLEGAFHDVDGIAPALGEHGDFLMRKRKSAKAYISAALYYLRERQLQAKAKENTVDNAQETLALRRAQLEEYLNKGSLD